MTASNFTTCLAIILREEGGNDDDPHDHGGRTSRGIVQREWDSFRKSHGGRPADVWKASDADIALIYKEQYWQPYCDDLPSGVDLCYFNASVNSGRTQATKELQRALGLKVDGMMGLITRQAVSDSDDIKALIKAMSDYRRKFYKALAQFSRYGRGWMARTDRVEALALDLAAKKPVAKRMVKIAEPEASPKSDPKSVAEPLVSKEASAATATSSALGGGIIDQIKEAAEPLSGFADTLAILKYILIAIAVVSFGLTIYAILHNRRTKEAIG